AQHTIEQGTQFNFIEYGGGGLHYFFSDGWAATIEGRFRHLSNSGIEKPNSGINTTFILAGIAHKF
ncbi:MAG: acyloxyacyl hydrolase, partial [Candidatus Omnitrophica bacterium]|nr:acyloxyacyl hydrolase [Candidatus Omnitrophota bacterium]